MSYEAELAFAKDLAYEAGDIMRRYFQAKDIDKQWKEDNTPITVADKSINDLVIEKVKRQFPGHSVVGEEASFEAEGSFTWVVDPIDGTVPFVLGIPISTISLALVEKEFGQPIVGIVYDPHLDNLYTATKGDGAFMNKMPIWVSSETTLERTYVSVLGGNEKEDKIYFQQGKCIDLVRAQNSKTLSMQSQAYCGAKVASGDLAGSIFGYGAPWDVAATTLLVQEAGGIVSDIYGKQRRYDEFADGSIHAPTKAMHQLLLDIVKRAGS